MTAIHHLPRAWIYIAVAFLCPCLWTGAGFIGLLPEGYIKAPEPVWVSLSPHGKHVAIATGRDLDNRSLSIYDCKTQALELRIDRIDDETHSVSYSSNDKFVAAFGPEDQVIVWELPTGREVASLPITCNGCDGVGNRLPPRFLKDSAYLLLEAETKDSSHLFSIWNIEKKKKEWEFQCTAISLSHDSTSLIEWREEDKKHSLFAWNISDPSKPILVGSKTLEADEIALCDDGHHFVSIRNNWLTTELSRQKVSGDEANRSITLDGEWSLVSRYGAFDFTLLYQEFGPHPLHPGMDVDSSTRNIAVKTWDGPLRRYGPYFSEPDSTPSGHCLSIGPNPASLFVVRSGRVFSSKERMRKRFVESLEQSDVFYQSPMGSFVIVRSSLDVDWRSRLLSLFRPGAWQSGDPSEKVEIWSLENQDLCVSSESTEYRHLNISGDDSAAALCGKDRVLLYRLPRNHVAASLTMRFFCGALLLLSIFALVRKPAPAKRATEGTLIPAK